MTGFALAQQVGDSQQIVGQDGRTHEHLKALTPFEETALHAPAAKEHGDATFNAGAEALSLLEGWALLVGGSLQRLVPAPLGDTDLSDTGLLTSLLMAGVIKTSIPGVEFRSAAEDFLVTLE